MSLTISAERFIVWARRCAHVQQSLHNSVMWWTVSVSVFTPKMRKWQLVPVCSCAIGALFYQLLLRGRGDTEILSLHRHPLSFCRIVSFCGNMAVTVWSGSMVSWPVVCFEKTKRVVVVENLVGLPFRSGYSFRLIQALKKWLLGEPPPPPPEPTIAIWPTEILMYIFTNIVWPYWPNM